MGTKVSHIAHQLQPSAIFAAMSVDLLDDRYFLINLILTVTMQMLGFAVSALCKSEQLFDFIGGLNFIACAVMTMVLKDSYDDRTIAIVTVVVASRLYLAGFLAFRVIKRKGDTRFDNVRENNLKIFAAFFYQIIWVYTVSTPVIFIVGTGDRYTSGLKASAYLQKYFFRADPANKLRVCDSGLWKLSRHPNYLGEVMIWCGVFIAGIEIFRHDNVGFSTIVSPLFTSVLLLTLSGIPTAEGAALKRFHSTAESAAVFKEYFESTPPLLCCCCGFYRILPSWCKLICCCELPMYRYVDDSSDDEAGSSGSARSHSTKLTDESQQSATCPAAPPTMESPVLVS